MNRSIDESNLPLFGGWLATLMGVMFIGLAPTAVADPALPSAGSESAADTVSAFEASGYDVQVNYPQGNPNVPLSECRVSAIRDFNGPMASLMMLSPVDIDVLCPNAK